MANDGAPWYRDAAARSLILRRYLPWLAGLSLAWEIAQLPLYTIWNDGRPAYIAFAVVHCTAGDVLIATSYTAFSEWMNTFVLRSWEYSELMPRVSLGDIELGVSPLTQWLVIPPLALWLASLRKLAAR